MAAFFFFFKEFELAESDETCQYDFWDRLHILQLTDGGVLLRQVMQLFSLLSLFKSNREM